MSLLMAIDPGPAMSAFCTIDHDYKPVAFAKVNNNILVEQLSTGPRAIGHDIRLTHTPVVIEQIGHYGTGMPAGASVFDTCIWIGRFIQALHTHGGPNAELIKRATVKTHLCGSAKATDGNIIQALIDRFAPTTGNHGKGGKNQPGFFWGFHSDIWQAFALAVYYHDTHIKQEP